MESEQQSSKVDRKCGASHVIPGCLATLAGRLSFLSLSAERIGLKSMCVCACVCVKERQRDRDNGGGETEIEERQRETQ